MPETPNPEACPKCGAAWSQDIGHSGSLQRVFECGSWTWPKRADDRLQEFQSKDCRIAALSAEVEALKADVVQLQKERYLLARLSTGRPQFYSPLEAAMVLRMRDEILAEETHE